MRKKKSAENEFFAKNILPFGVIMLRSGKASSLTECILLVKIPHFSPSAIFSIKGESFPTENLLFFSFFPFFSFFSLSCEFRLISDEFCSCEQLFTKLVASTKKRVFMCKILKKTRKTRIILIYSQIIQKKRIVFRLQTCELLL